MNKLFVMLPLMLASRKLDSEDEQTIFYLRVSYGIAQLILICCALIMFMKANALKSTADGQKTIYVPPAPQPFEDPNAKKKYTEVIYGEHIYNQAFNNVGSTLFGMALTVGLHIYRGVIVGLAMQTIMGPIGLFESPLVKLFFMGGTKVFNEKTKEELTPDDEVVDKEGNEIKAAPAKPAIESKEKEAKQPEPKKSFEDLLLDTWDEGSEADITPLVNALNTSNINSRTSENQWTPLMIMAGLGAKNSTSAMKKMKELGADPLLTDGEGWNAMHWAAYHGSVDAIKVLESEFDAVSLGLHLVKDKEGKIAVDHAIAEGNDGARLELEKLDACEEGDEGLRKRK